MRTTRGRGLEGGMFFLQIQEENKSGSKAKESRRQNKGHMEQAADDISALNLSLKTSLSANLIFSCHLLPLEWQDYERHN